MSTPLTPLSLTPPMGSFRICRKCGQERHLAQFPKLKDASEERSPICVCCPPYTEHGLYQQSEPMSTVSEFAEREKERKRNRQTMAAQSFVFEGRRTVR